MMRLTAFFAALTFSNSLLPPCGDSDVSCLKLHLVDQGFQLQEQANQIAALQGQLVLSGQQLTLAQSAVKISLDAAQASNAFAQKIQEETRSHWYQAPGLWFALGAFVASGLAIGIAAAISHVTR